MGPLIGGAVADAFDSLRAPFLIAGAAVTLVAGAVAVVPTGIPRPHENQAHGVVVNPASPHRQRRNVRRLVFALLLAQCAIMITQPLISLRVRELVGQRENLATLAGLAFSVVGLGGLLAAPLLGHLSDRFGAGRLLLWIVIAATACLVPQAFTASYSWFVAERFIAGVFLCSVIPVVNSMVARSVADEDRGPAFGATSGAAFLGAFIGPVSGGLLGAQFGLTAVFLVSAFILMINAFWIGCTIWPGRDWNPRP
jgi:MFS family permease